MLHTTNHARVLGLKFTYTAVTILSVFALFGSTAPVQQLPAVVAVTGFTYVLGDLWVLPRFGSMVTAGVEATLTGVVIWAVELVLHGFTVPVRAILVSAVLVGAAELWLHRLLGREIPSGP